MSQATARLERGPAIRFRGLPGPFKRSKKAWHGPPGVRPHDLEPVDSRGHGFHDNPGLGVGHLRVRVPMD